MSEKIADISFPDDDGPTIIDHSNLNLEREVKEAVNSCFAKFNYKLEGMTDKYQIKMDDLTKRIDELETYLNQYFDEEEVSNSPLRRNEKKY